MRVAMTVTTTAGGRQDVVVEAHGPHDGAEVAEALTRALALDPGSSLWAGDEQLGAGQRLGFPPLVAGAVLLVRSRPPASRRLPSNGSSPLRLAVTAGRDAGRDLELRRGRYTVGRGAGCELVVDDPAMSRAHAVVTADERGVHVRDLDVTNPSTVNGAPIPPEGLRITAADVLTLGGHRLELVAPSPHAVTATARGDGTLSVSPAPAPNPPPPETVVTFPPAPTVPRPRGLPWAMLLLPLPLAGVLALVLGPRMLVFALFSPVMILGSALSDRFGSRSQLRHEQAAWSRDTRAAQRQLDEVLAGERRARMQAHPGPYQIRRTATLPTARLWERRDDLARPIRLRIGIGEVTARTRARLDGRGPEPVPLRQAPVVLDLDEHPVVGVVGDRPDTGRLARWLVGQALALHPPGDLVVLMLGEPSWMSGLRHAPHVRPVDLADLTELDHSAETGPGRPTLLLVTEDPARLRDDSRWRALLTSGAKSSIRVLMTSTTQASLPHECRTTVELDGARAALRSATTTTIATTDGADDAWGEEVGRALAPLRDATPSDVTSLPSRVSLVELLESPAGQSPDDPHQHAAEGLAAVIGTSVDGPLSIDLVADGPHALVGGTTGSGKSELLQTWVASLAQSYGPDLLSFVLVDYKGGAAFAGCAGLPHTVGMLTDLDPSETRRALRSLQAEVRRRERLLADLGCSEIDTFRVRGGTLPRLVLVVDEFRALAEEQPEALKELVHLAAVGRSLGLHLVLATQRPSGVITPEIRANVNLRIALRVRDRHDSEDIIGSAEAAHLPEGTPGRALLRTGGEPATSFQAAYVGGRTSNGPSLVVHTGLSVRGDLPREGTTPTDLEALVARQQDAWARSDVPAPHRPWQPPLPALVAEAQLPPAKPGQVAWGLVDLPDEQRWDSLSWGPEDGHLLVLGGPGSGRTTAACSLVSRTATGAPNGAVVHALVPPGPLADRLARAPGVESVLDPADRSAARRLLARARREIDDRRDLLRRSGYATMSEWAGSGAADNPAPPSLVLVIDSWSHLVDEHSARAHEIAHEVELLARDGMAAGVRLVVTGGRDLATSRLASVIGARLVLHLPDRHDALAAGLRPGELAERAIPGRGLLLPARTLAQVAPIPPADPPAPVTTAARRPWRIVELPRRVTLAELTTPDAHLTASRARSGPVLGHSGEVGQPVRLPPDTDGTWCVVGPRRAGRTTALRLVADQLLGTGRPLVQVASTGRTVPGEHPVLGPDDVEGLVACIRRHDAPVVLVDDIDELDGAPVHEALRALVDHCSRSGALLLAATTPQAATGVRGLAPLACRARAGLLLQPQDRSDGGPLGVRVPPSERIPGRGYLVDRGEVTELQVALPPDPVEGAA